MENKKQKLNIVFTSSGQYPYGEASTNRHLSYARGLVELGHSVCFILLQPQKNFDNEQKTFYYNGIRFEYFQNSNKRKTNLSISSLILLLKILNSAKRRIKAINTSEIISALVLLDTNVLFLESFIKLGKNLGVKIFHERTEYPFLTMGNSIFHKLNFSIYIKSTIHKFNGIYVINNELQRYFKKITKNKIEIEKVLMCVEPDRFATTIKPSKFDFEYIAYCGSMYGDKDGVLILLEAFAQISKTWPDIKLLLIGENKDTDKIKPINENILRTNLIKRVVFTGEVKRDEIPNLLCNAKILALARPNNMQAKGGFPTKLGEYLATGNPTVVTSVGEINNFLIDGINSFIAKPDDASSFAIKLNQVLSDYKFALKIANEGKKLTLEVFNYKKQAEILSNFIYKISQK